MRRGFSLALVAMVGCGQSASAPVVAGGEDAAPGCTGDTVTKDVSFASADGLIVHGTSSNPCGGAPGPVVVLVHQLCRDRKEWIEPSHDWVSSLGKRGLATLAIDLRGHGASKSFPDGSTHDLCAESSSAPATLFAGMPQDVTAAVAHARSEQSAPAVALVSASIGGNSALVAFAADPKIAMVVALSPGTDYRGITTEGSIKSVGARPVLLEAARDDKSSADATDQLKTDNPAIQTQVWPVGGHGNAMIDAHPDELGRIVDLVASSF